MPGETVENKKFVLTNRVAVIILLAVASAVFSATKFYDQTQYQALVAQQNADKIKALKEENRELKEEHEGDIKIVMGFVTELVKQEVGGLRTDWERKNKDNQIQEDKQDARIEKLKNY